MLEYEIAAIYYFVAGIITAQAYFEEVPLGIAGNHGEAEKSAAGR